MLRRRLVQTALCLVAGAHALGCYADSVKVPEPTLTTPGAFIAVPFEPALPSGAAGATGQAGEAGESVSTSGESSAGSDDELYSLIRVLAVLDVSNDLAIFHLQYGTVESLDAAREAITSHPSGPPPPLGITSLSRLESRGAVVVGFRSLTEAEQEVIR